MTDLKHLFTIDDAPPSKWHEKFFDMYSWCTVEAAAIIHPKIYAPIIIFLHPI